MLPPRSLTRALVAAALVGAALVSGASSSTAVTAPERAAGATVARVPGASEEATPLTVTMTSMSPATVPTRGPITITGTVANASQDQWTDVSLAPFVSSTPITTREELAQAAATDEADPVGSRLADPSTYVTFASLAPGQQRSFTLRIPRASLGIPADVPGVYWIGVHALGTGPQGRDLVADGRARSFIPLVSRAEARRSVDVSLVLPLRERARRAADGSLNAPQRWATLTGSDGRLARLAAFAASAGAAPVTWALDPAVLDALDDYSRGNPALSLGSARRVSASSASSSASPSPSPSTSASASPAESVDPQEKHTVDAPTDTQRSNAASVLASLLASVRSNTVLTLPYADPDVAATARHRPNLLTRARDLAARRMQALGLNGQPAISPPDGFFDPGLLSRLGRDTLLLVGDEGVLSRPAYATLPGGEPLVRSDDRASAGGPSPTDPTDPLALRQRVLAEAALAVQSHQHRPLVVRLPSGWDPGPDWSQADFFGGLRQSWVHLVPVARGGSPRADPATLTYDRTERSAELGAATLDTARALVDTGDVLGRLLANRNDVRDAITAAALQAASYSARSSTRVADGLVRALDLTVRERMSHVQVTGNDLVTLSAGSGLLTVTVFNGLAQPITVGLRTRTDNPQLQVASADPVELGPGQRTTVRLSVTSKQGLHDVTVYPVTTDGQLVGTPLHFSVRTSQVGQVIWYVLVGGLGLLAVMIIRRIVLRVRNRQWRLDETP